MQMSQNFITQFKAQNPWLRTIDIWDDKYDYVMHDDHWLTTRWSSNCPRCVARGKRPESPVLNGDKPTTSSPAKLSTSLNSTSNDPTLKPEDNNNHHNNDNLIGLTPPPPLSASIPVTPIAPTNISTRAAFVTPYTTNKYAIGGNETFNRTTRQSAKKLLDQTTSQDLIDLNETFDLYRSALAETPQITPNNTQLPVSSKIPKPPLRQARYDYHTTNHS